MPIHPYEKLIRGEWQFVDGRMIADPSALRIRALIDTELEKIGSASGGWETLYRDRRDGRFWELFYPHNEMQGGGPESLRSIDSAEAAHKYGVTFGASVKRDIDLIIEQLTATIPGLRVQQLKVKHPGADDDGLWFINIPDLDGEVQIESSEAAMGYHFKTGHEKSENARRFRLADWVSRCDTLPIFWRQRPSRAPTRSTALKPEFSFVTNKISAYHPGVPTKELRRSLLVSHSTPTERITARRGRFPRAWLARMDCHTSLPRQLKPFEGSQ